MKIQQKLEDFLGEINSEISRLNNLKETLEKFLLNSNESASLTIDEPVEVPFEETITPIPVRNRNLSNSRSNLMAKRQAVAKKMGLGNYARITKAERQAVNRAVNKELNITKRER